MSYVFQTSGGGTPGEDIRTLTGNAGGAVGPNGVYNINIVGGGAVTVTGDPGTNTLTITDGGAASTQFDTDSGSAVPAANILDILGSHGLNTTGATNVVTVLMDNAITLGDLSAIAAGSPALTLTTGDLDITAGSINLPTTTATAGIININSTPFIQATGFANTFVGFNSGNFTLSGSSNSALGNETLNDVTSGTNNVAIGNLAADNLTTASNVVALGAGSLGALQTGNYNTALGSLALDSVVSGTNNIGIGLSGGGALTGNDSDNIIIGHTGTIGDNGKIIIGTNATHTSAYIAGIDGVNVGNVATVVTESGDQLGTAVITGGTNITVVATANTITINGSGVGVETIDGDSGSATGDPITITGGTSGAVFTGAGSTLTESFDFLSLPVTTATDGQIIINTFPVLHTYEGGGSGSVFVGSLSGNFTNTGSGNTALGGDSLSAVTNGEGNIAIGFEELNSLTSGNNNISIGAGSGGGTDDGIISIGTNGTHTSVFFAGIEDVDLSTAKVVTVSSSTNNDELGSATLTAGTNISISTATADQIIISASADLELTYTAVNTSPYVVLATDQFLGVDSSGGAIQVNLPNAPATGRVFNIKDSTGSAAGTNITVTTVGGVVNIDGATTFVLNSAYQAINVIFTGSEYLVY